MVPSSFMISTSTPAGLNPASRAKSIAASVCPALRNTPPFFALRGKICPGRPGPRVLYLIYKSFNGPVPVLGRYPCGYLFMDQVHRNGKWCPMNGRIFTNHQFQAKRLTSFLNDGCTDQSATMGSHKIDDLRSNTIRGTDKITFILPVFIIHHNDHLPVLYCLDCIFYGI
jgi:hypothetical protein